MTLRVLALGLFFPLLAASARAQTVEIDASLPYAFHRWNTTGYSGDLGVYFAGHDFFGLEFNAFSPKPTNFYPGLGSVQSSQQIQSLLAAYRFYIPLAHFGVSATDYTPLELYLGLGAGLGRVKETLAYTPAVAAAYGAQASASATELTGELVGGLQYNFGPHVGLKAGYRYIDSVNNVKQFGSDTNTDTKTVEIGIVFRL